jgi:hypothetical protein
MSGLAPRPSREFAPAGDLLLWASKEVGKFSKSGEAKDAPEKPPTRLRVGALRCSKPRAAPNSLRSLRSLRSNKRRESVLEACCARALGFCASRRFLRGSFGTAQQPTARPASRLAPAVRYAPFSTAEQRKALRPCAQRTSSSDSTQLSDRSVAKGVLRGASKPEQRRAPAAQRRAVRPGGALCLLSGGPESRSPAGAKSRHHSWRQTEGAQP